MEDNKKFDILNHTQNQSNTVVSFPDGQTFKIGVLLDNINELFPNSALSKISDGLAEKGLGKLPNWNAHYWNSRGVEAEILNPKSSGWKKGKVRLRVVLEFCLDEPEDTTTDNLDNNSLDEIRKTIS